MTPQFPLPPAPGLALRVVRLLLATVAALLLAIALFALIRAGVFYWLYTRIFAQVVELTGYDLWAARAVTLGAVALLWFLPWHVVVLPWIGGAGRRAVALFAVTLVTVVTIDFVTRDVYFARTDGHPLKYYILTLEGYKLASSPGIDPAYGIPYRPITQDVAKHYLLWEKRGGRMQDPALLKGQYFSPATGEPLRWYSRMPDGRIEMFTLPGFHPKYSTKLLPATAEIVADYEKQQAEEARKRHEREERDARRRARIEAARRSQEEAERQAREAEIRAQPLQPGRYIFADLRPSGTIGGFRFTLSEVDWIADKLLVHLDVANAGVNPQTEAPPRFIRLALITQQGIAIGYAAIRATEGAVTDHSTGIYFPEVGKRGAFVMKFQRPDPLATFSITINDQPLLAAINLHRAQFQSF